MAHNLHVVILAGGSGTRFWPLSRELFPKQMLTVFGGESLIVRTLRRAAQVVDPGATVRIVVGPELLDEVRNHLAGNPACAGLDIRYVVEPCARNTAPALALAAATIKIADPEALVLMLPSDHLCEDGDRWRAVVEAARVRAIAGDLVTVGLTPTRPETGYGYICAGAEVLASAPAHGNAAAHAAVRTVERFVEKPDAVTARSYLEQGTYLWNSGMLLGSARTIIKQLRMAHALQPEGEYTFYSGQIASAAETLADMGPTAYTQPAAQFLYSELPSVPFDRAVLEVSACVSVVPTDLAWSDVGSLLALEDLAEPDAQGNRFIGPSVDVDSHDLLVYNGPQPPAEQRLIATLGLENVMVVDTADATLIADCSRAQDVRAVVAALRERQAPELVQSRTSLRPWGSWTMLVRSQGYHVKEVDVRPGCRLSLQSHTKRAEHWIVIAGTATVECDGTVQTLAPGESVFIPVGARHRLANDGTDDLRVVEVATGSYLGEDDIERYDDDFGRDAVE